MNQPLVSVVIPVYNAEKYLDRCLTSVVNQTYINIEILLVDDGSWDSSPALCDRWAEKDGRIRVIHKENAGAGYARNTGLDHATGRYLFFVDSDDYVDPAAIELCILAMNAQKAQAVLFGRNNAYPDDRTERTPVVAKKFVFEENEVKEELLPGLFNYEMGFGISVWGKMLDLTLIREHQIRFPSEREMMSEDAHFILEFFAYVEKAVILPANLYYYFQNTASYSRTYRADFQELDDCFLTRCTETCKALGYPPKVLHHIQARYQIYAIAGMKQILTADLPPNQKKDALKAIFHHPLLHSTLTNEVLMLGNRSSLLFWKLFRIKCYGLCRLMLWYKTRRS